MTAILQVFGAFLLWLYKFCHSYALALIVFTLLTKVVLFPLSYKGKKGMMQMNTLQVEMNRLQQQYGKNRAKYNEEVQKLYQREGSAQRPLAVSLHLLLLGIEGLQINHQEVVFTGRLLDFYGATQTGDRVLRVIHFLIDSGAIAFCPELIQFPGCRQTVDNRQHPFVIPLSVSGQYQ